VTRARHLVAFLAVGCIIPDREIRIDPGIGNENAVRIVQRAPQMPDMNIICNADMNFDTAFCPEVPESRPSGLIQPVGGGDFCICPPGPGGRGHDRRAIARFEVYAEDGDIEGDDPEDTLYGVLLLDPDPRSESPDFAQAYFQHWKPCDPGVRVPFLDDTEGQRTGEPVGRASTDLWVFEIGDPSDEIDLCNDSMHTMTPGLHDLQFMVSDREFFRPRRVAANGEEVFAPPQCGVPDLAAGATYAVIDYVFECRDPADPDADCDCEVVE